MFTDGTWNGWPASFPLKSSSIFRSGTTSPGSDTAVCNDSPPGGIAPKNRAFTEEDKQEVLARQTAIRQIVPMYKALQDRGQIRLTTTPFFTRSFHWSSTRSSRVAPDPTCRFQPGFMHRPMLGPSQARRGYHTTHVRPRSGWALAVRRIGLPEVLPIVAQAGIRWLATDEGILYRSLQMAGQGGTATIISTSPMRSGPGTPLAMVFRDRDISDAFGFVYHKTTPEAAADDVLRRIRSLAYDIRLDNGTIAVILDGENPWGHYHDGGERFLSLLFRAFESDGLQLGNGIRVTLNTMVTP